MDPEKGQIEYSQNGDSDKYILLIHGTPRGVHKVEGTQFVNKDYSTLGVSRPGYNHTPLSSGKTPTEQAALYESLLVKLNIESVYVYGSSGGGPSSIQFALDYLERCTGLILNAAVSEKIENRDCEDDILEKLYKTEFGVWLELLIESYQKGERTIDGINRYIANGILPGYIGYKNDLYQFCNLKDFPLEKMTMPVFLIHGTEDSAVPFSFSQNAASRIPNATLFEMKGKDHNAAIYYADSINQEIYKFLKSLEEKKN